MNRTIQLIKQKQKETGLNATLFSAMIGAKKSDYYCWLKGKSFPKAATFNTFLAKFEINDLEVRRQYGVDYLEWSKKSNLGKRKERFLNKEFFENELKRLNELKEQAPDNSVLMLYFEAMQMLTKESINENTQYYDVITLLMNEFETQRSSTKDVLIKAELGFQIDYLQDLRKNYAYYSYRFNKKI